MAESIQLVFIQMDNLALLIATRFYESCSNPELHIDSTQIEALRQGKREVAFL